MMGPTWPIAPTAPFFADRHEAAGTAQGHYFHQDLLVAQLIFARCPRLHVDVGSRVDGFVAHVAAFRAIQVFDIRPLLVAVPNIIFKQANLMSPSELHVDYCDSLSCLHALEHFGLGRYGDPLDADGWRAGLEGLTRLLQYQGRLYLSVPIGRQRIEFNGHRVFAPTTLVHEGERLGLALAAFHFVDDVGLLHRDLPGDATGVEKARGLEYGCGIYEFIKSGRKSAPTEIAV